MRTYIDCIPCFLRQGLEAAKLAGADDALQKSILDEICGLIPCFALSSSPPQMGRTIYHIVRARTQSDDPFKQVKNKSNQLALGLLPDLRKKIAKSEHKFLTAVELAIAGNVIDFGVKNSLKIEQEVNNFINGNFDIHNQYNKSVFAFDGFMTALLKAKRVLYLADNAGETVFDLLLIEQIRTLPNVEDIVYAVKDKPIINDALMDDAVICGIDEVARVMSSGSDAPGTFLKSCSSDFLNIYNNSDLIISKGQGNFEALSDEDKAIYFLFRAKCEVVAKDIGVAVGDVILKRSGKHAHIRV